MYLCKCIFGSIVPKGSGCENSLMRFSISPELLRDLMESIQAAKDSVPRNSLFAMQLDMVLDKAKVETGVSLPPRSTDNQRCFAMAD